LQINQYHDLFRKHKTSSHGEQTWKLLNPIEIMEDVSDLTTVPDPSEYMQTA